MEIGGCFAEGGVAELEAGFQQAARDHAAAFDDQLCFGAEEEGADFQHPLSGGEAE